MASQSVVDEREMKRLGRYLQGDWFPGHGVGAKRTICFAKRRLSNHAILDAMARLLRDTMRVEHVEMLKIHVGS